MACKAVTLNLNVKIDVKWTFRAVYGEPTRLSEGYHSMMNCVALLMLGTNSLSVVLSEECKDHSGRPSR